MATQPDTDAADGEAVRELARCRSVARALHELATGLAPLTDEDEVLWEITRRCIALLGFEDCVIYLVDPQRPVLIQKAAYGPKQAGPAAIHNPIEIPVGRGIVGTVAATGRTERIRNTHGDPRYILDDQPRLSELAVPIVAEGRVLGVIDSEHSREDFFTPDHEEILTTLAALCAHKLLRARAERELRELNQQLEQRVRARTAELEAANERLRHEVRERARAETEREAGARLLSVSEERFRKAFRLMPAHLSIVRLADQCFTEVNEPLVANSGYTRDELIGHSTGDLNLWVDPNERDRFFQELEIHGFVHRFATRFRKKDGRIDHTLLSAETVEFDGEPSVLALSIPINELKQTEEDLRRALDRERELHQLKTAFVSLVSHEFRTPIGVIHSSAEILDRYGARLEPEERSRHLAAIRKHAWRMADLMESVLVFARADAGRLDFRPTDFNLADAVSEWCDEIRQSSHGRTDVALTVPADLPPAHGDPELVRHIVVNLLSNAVKYSAPGMPVEVSLTRQTGDVRIEVRDHGVGIPPEDRPRLFLPFERGANVSHIPGTGLGLVVIRRCLERHGGRIELDSAPNAGTRAIVHLPLFTSP